jgi:HPt (histidine-containing phosphotransfer) domain-containing protein
MSEKWLRPDRDMGSPAAMEAGDSRNDGIFDESDFMQRNMHDEELGRDVISLYIVSAADSLTLLQEALAAGDAKGVRELAHSLKGASATISAPAMHRMAAELEMAGKNGELGRSGPLLHGLNDAFEDLKSMLEKQGWYRRPPGPRD